MGDHSALSCHRMESKAGSSLVCGQRCDGRGRVRDARSLAVTMGDEATSQGTQQPLAAERGEETILPPSLRREAAPQHPDCSSVRPALDSGPKELVRQSTRVTARHFISGSFSEQQ